MLEMMKFGKICMTQAKLLKIIGSFIEPAGEKHYLRYICFNQLRVIYPWVG